jgi:hypothetical protein
MVPVGMGLACGLALSLALNQSLKSLFYEVAPSDPLVLIGVIVAMATRRALSIDPASTLRAET